MRDPESKTHQLIDFETATTLGSSFGTSADKDRAALLFERSCRHYARMFGATLSIEDHEDLAQGVFERALPLFRSFAKGDGESIEGVNRLILQDIWRTRKRLAKAATNSCEPQDEGTDPVDPLSALIERDLYARIASQASDLLQEALESLLDRDYDIIVLHYRFKQLGMAVKNTLLPVSAEAKKKALQRARKRFKEALERLTVTRLARDPADRDLLELLLKAIRGDLIGRLVEEAAQR